jgi:ribosomal-protein-alanine N-acetyltransferase
MACNSGAMPWNTWRMLPALAWRRRQGSIASGPPPELPGLALVEAATLPDQVVQAYDAVREASPRPHFLRDWLHHPAGTVLALVDPLGQCHGFGRIRPCLLPQGSGWRIGPLLADSPGLAELLLLGLLDRHPGVVLLDAPGANPAAAALMGKLGFTTSSATLRMYRGEQPSVSLADVYGLACLELG